MKKYSYKSKNIHISQKIFISTFLIIYFSADISIILLFKIKKKYGDIVHKAQKNVFFNKKANISQREKTIYKRGFYYQILSIKY